MRGFAADDRFDEAGSDLFEVGEATKAGAPLLIELFGPSESGKTLSALLMARGLAGDDGDVALMDTEGGRGRMFADQVPSGYKYGWLRPPFTVENYERGIEIFLQRYQKLRVLVIDSASHCWSAQGGVLDQVDRAEANNVPMRMRWTKPKRRYNRFVDYLTTSRIHIILCSRARQPIEEKRVNGRAEMVSMPWQPIRSPSLRYELTICLPMAKDGFYDLDNPLWKCPGDLRPLFPGGSHRPSVETGQRMAVWVAGGEPVDVGLELLIKRAYDQAERGTEKMRAYWENTLTRDERVKLAKHVAALQSAARSADQALEEERLAAEATGEDQPAEADDLANPFGASAMTVGEAKTVDRAEAISVENGGLPLARTAQAVEIVKPAGGRANWVETRKRLIEAFYKLSTVDDCDRFRQTNSATIAALRAGSAAEHDLYQDLVNAHERGLRGG